MSARQVRSERLRHARKMLGWSQSAVAYATGETRVRVSRFERSIGREPDMGFVSALAALAGVHPSFFFGDEA